MAHKKVTANQVTLYMEAMNIRDVHPNASVRALSDEAVISVVNRGLAQANGGGRAKSKPARSYADPTGDKASARASRRH